MVLGVTVVPGCTGSLVSRFGVFRGESRTVQGPSRVVSIRYVFVDRPGCYIKTKVRTQGRVPERVFDVGTT